jgi:hypothetical protein
LPEVELRKDTAEWLGSRVRRAVAEPRPDIVGAVLAEGVGGAVALAGAVNKAVYVPRLGRDARRVLERGDVALRDQLRRRARLARRKEFR